MKIGGVHPLGNGIDRYIKTTDLSTEALDYLKKQGKLQWLNMVSPMIVGVRSIGLKDGLSFNFAVRNYLTSFGNDISLNVLLKNKSHNFVLAYHHYSNYNKSFPALECKWFEHPLNLGKQKILLTPTVIVGIQPKNQSFTTKDAAFLGAASCRIEWLTNSIINAYTELSLKTKGWVAGNEFLNNSTSIKFGICARFN